MTSSSSYRVAEAQPMQEHGEEVYSIAVEDVKITIRKVAFERDRKMTFERGEIKIPRVRSARWEVTFEQLELPSYEGAAPPMRFKARQKLATFLCSDQQMATFIRMVQAMSAPGV